MPTNTDIIVREANLDGIPPWIPLDIARVESSLNTYEVGDNGTSFGLFQLHKGGLLGSLTPQQAFDPFTNAHVAIKAMLPAYQSGVRQGLTNEDLLQYTAFNSGWPGSLGVGWTQRNRPDYVNALHSSYLAQSPSMNTIDTGGAGGGVIRVQNPQDYIRQNVTNEGAASTFRQVSELERVESFQDWKKRAGWSANLNPLNYFMDEGQKMLFRSVIVLIGLAIIIIALVRMIQPVLDTAAKTAGAAAAEGGAAVV